MGDLVERVRAEGENPASFYPWLIKMLPITRGVRRGKHQYFTADEIEAVNSPTRTPQTVERRSPGGTK